MLGQVVLDNVGAKGSHAHPQSAPCGAVAVADAVEDSQEKNVVVVVVVVVALREGSCVGDRAQPCVVVVAVVEGGKQTLAQVPT